VITSKDANIYFSGDSGYGKHFAQIGENYGPFDLALIECGQYNTMWPDIHMFPEESAQAGLDLKAKALMPIHWGAFKLSTHAWTEPILQIRKKAHALGLPIVSPKIGAPIRIDKLPEPSSVWW
jgi:L-ascorbate metabolism protein UlaG (beta-lactamase superfamily)